MLAPKRRTLSKSAAAERAQKLNEFLADADVKKDILAQPPHKRVNYIRVEFEKKTDIKMPVSSIYKFLREMESRPDSVPDKEPEPEKAE